MSNTLMTIPLDQLVPGDNIRTDLGDLTEMAASIKAVGILEPLLVRRVEAGYEVVAGHRRLAAAKKAKAVEVPCVVRSFTDDERDEAMLIENLQRKDLSPVEEARGYFRLVERGMKAKELAKRVGRPAEHVTDRLALLALDDEVLAAVHEGRTSLASAGALLVLAAENVRADLAEPVRARALDGHNVTGYVEQAVRAEKANRIADDIEAKGVKAGLPVVVRRSNADQVSVQRVGLNVNAAYDEKVVRVDEHAHKSEPCNVIYVDLVRGYGAPKAQVACSDPARHLTKGDSPLKVAKRKASTSLSPESEKKVAKAKEKAERQTARVKAALHVLTQGQVNTLALLSVLGDIDAEDSKNACALLELDVIKIEHPWDKKKDGTPKTNPDYTSTLYLEASSSKSAERRVVAALCVARARSSYRIRGAYKDDMLAVVESAASLALGPDPDAPKPKPEPTVPDPAEPMTAEPLPVDPEPVTSSLADSPLAPEAEGLIDQALEADEQAYADASADNSWEAEAEAEEMAGQQ